MTEQEVLVDLVRKLQDRLHEEIGDLPLEAMGWKPDPGANSIAVTGWHIGRLLDDLNAKFLENRPAEEQVWLAGGWSSRTGYDPRGIGHLGRGMLLDYTPEEVAQVPVLPAHQLLAYIDQAGEALSATLGGLSSDALSRRAPGVPSKDEWTAYRCIKTFLTDAFAHLGEIRAYKAMRERLTEAG